jgi:alkanesulfonate monooxygenase SsuD/methylene tetrahydromethanopterin reductase-like flavin-dependent oxidoreductase (luciferase family)
MRALWTQEVVNFEGRWHKITHAGINPLPVQQPIPVWIGIGRGVNNDPPEQVLRRVARISDGWFPMISPDEVGQQVIARVHDYAREAGRDPSSIGMEFRVRIAGRPTEDWVTEAKAWEDMGATHLTVETRRGGLSSTDEHIEAIRQFKEALK